MAMKHLLRLCLDSGRHLRSKRKVHFMPMSEAVFKKHEYAMSAKMIIKLVEDFYLRPPEFKGSAASRLPNLLEKLREQLF